MQTSFVSTTRRTFPPNSASRAARDFKSPLRLSKSLVRENAPARKANPAFSQRYMDPKYSRWLSADPAVGDYMSQTEKGEGGIYNLANLILYHYGNNNPLRYTDPTGAFDEATGTIEGGDTLSQIAEDYNNKHGTDTTADDWAKANNISDPDKIYAGAHLNAPPSQQSGRGSAGGSAGSAGNSAATGGGEGWHPPMAIPEWHVSGEGSGVGIFASAIFGAGNEIDISRYGMDFKVQESGKSYSGQFASLNTGGVGLKFGFGAYFVTLEASGVFYGEEPNRDTIFDSFSGYANMRSVSAGWFGIGGAQTSNWTVKTGTFGFSAGGSFGASSEDSFTRRVGR